MATKTSALLCGFCLTGNCDRCPSAVTNGDGQPIPCTHGCPKSLEQRCLACNNRRQSDIADWACTDRDACQARVEAHRRAALERLKVDPPETPAASARGPQVGHPATPAPAAPKVCLCCGQPTKGGKFLPGHDSRFLAARADDIKSGAAQMDQVLAEWADLGISEALQGKLAKRVSA